MLSVRPDLVPPEYVAELEKLQDAVAPMPFETVRLVIESELECPLEEVYATFAELPLGSASISQVHAAQLHDGAEALRRLLGRERPRPGNGAEAERPGADDDLAPDLPRADDPERLVPDPQRHEIPRNDRQCSGIGARRFDGNGRRG